MDSLLLSRQGIRILLITSIFYFYTAGIASAGITPVDQLREVRVWATASNQGEYDEQEGFASAPDFEPFTDGVSVEASVIGPPAAEASASAEQDSFFGTNVIEAHGLASCSAWNEFFGGEESNASCNSSSDFGIVFTVDQSSTWRLTGSLYIEGVYDNVVITFFEETLELLYVELNYTGGPESIDETFQLTPGKHYNLTATAYSCSVPAGGMDQAAASFDIIFIPEPTTLSILVIGSMVILSKRRH